MGSPRTQKMLASTEASVDRAFQYFLGLESIETAGCKWAAYKNVCSFGSLRDDLGHTDWGLGFISPSLEKGKPTPELPRSLNPPKSKP